MGNTNKRATSKRDQKSDYPEQICSTVQNSSTVQTGSLAQLTSTVQNISTVQSSSTFHTLEVLSEMEWDGSERRTGSTLVI
jgi:hypothetical protein